MPACLSPRDSSILILIATCGEMHRLMSLSTCTINCEMHIAWPQLHCATYHTPSVYDSYAQTDDDRLVLLHCSTCRRDLHCAANNLPRLGARSHPQRSVLLVKSFFFFSFSITWANLALLMTLACIPPQRLNPSTYEFSLFKIDRNLLRRRN